MEKTCSVVLIHFLVLGHPTQACCPAVPCFTYYTSLGSGNLKHSNIATGMELNKSTVQLPVVIYVISSSWNNDRMPCNTFRNTLVSHMLCNSFKLITNWMLQGYYWQTDDLVQKQLLSYFLAARNSAIWQKRTLRRHIADFHVYIKHQKYEINTLRSTAFIDFVPNAQFLWFWSYFCNLPHVASKVLCTFTAYIISYYAGLVLGISSLYNTV